MIFAKAMLLLGLLLPVPIALMANHGWQKILVGLDVITPIATPA
jgi:hypothetical protein